MVAPAKKEGEIRGTKVGFLGLVGEVYNIFNMKMPKKVPLAAVLAILGAVGYGGYTIVKETELDALKSGGVATYKVARVIDGDTFELADGDVVRLLGIDAPEEGECYYQESKQALDKLIIGKEVELRKD